MEVVEAALYVGRGARSIAKGENSGEGEREIIVETKKGRRGIFYVGLKV